MTSLDFLFHALEKKENNLVLSGSGRANLQERKIKTTTVRSTVDQKHVRNSQPIIIHVNKVNLQHIVGPETAPSTAVSSLACCLLFPVWLLHKFLENRRKDDFHVTGIFLSKKTNVSTNNFHPLSNNLNKS